MEKRIKVNLNGMDILRRFAGKVVTFQSDVNIIKGSIIYDAKSILAVVNINPTYDTYVEIVSDNESEINRFNEYMEEFRYE